MVAMKGECVPTIKRPKRAAAKKVVFQEDPDQDLEDQENFEDDTKQRVILRKRSVKSEESNPDLARDSELLNLLFMEPEAENAPNGILVEFDKYWPYGLESDEPENKNLVLFAVANACGKPECTICSISMQRYVDLKYVVQLSYRNCDADVRLDRLEAPGNGVEIDEFKDVFAKDILEILKTSDYYTSIHSKESIVADHGWDRKNYNPDRTIQLPPVAHICIEASRYILPIYHTTAKGACKPQDYKLPLHMKGIRAVCFQSKFYFYSVLEPEKIEDFLSEFTVCPHDRYSQNICATLQGDYLAGHLKDGYLKEVAVKVADLSDTADFPEAQIPEGFKLTLRDYQLRSLSWMKRIEAGGLYDQFCVTNTVPEKGKVGNVKIKLGESGWYVDLFGKAVTTNSRTSKIDIPIHIRGGVLADDTGSGKTITCLALVHYSPFNAENAKERALDLEASLPFRVPSKATCIVCPSNLHAQWISEAKRCNPSFKIVGISCMKEYDGVSWKDVILADLVVLSYQFLTNSKYSAHTKTLAQLLRDVPNQLDTTGKVKLTDIYFHRLIFDEIHEMGHKSTKCQSVAKSLKADSHWGITGTPTFEQPSDITELFPYLDISNSHEELFTANQMAQDEFLAKFVKRNVPDLKLPPVVHEVVWVTATPDELALMTLMNINERQQAAQIMACCHYQLSDKITNVVGEAFMSIDLVKQRLKKAKSLEVKTRQSEMERAAKRLDSLKRMAPDSDAKQDEKDGHEADVSSAENVLKRASSNFQVAQGDYNFFLNVFKSIETPDENDCLICREPIEPGELTMLPCSHFYCYACISVCMQNSNKCPFCKAEIQDRSVTMRIKAVGAAGNLEKKGLNTSKYGSKLIALYNYITDLHDKDPEARIILFLQYHVLADSIAATLRELDIKHARISGNVFKRQNAIDQFTKSKDVRLLMLSSEDSVSGMNLTQATHVILLHPFFTDQGEAVDVAWEKQGICRAYRGGLTHPLKVVRFAVKGTIEEELTLNRQGKI